MDQRGVQTTIVGLKSDCRAQPDLLRVASFEAAQTYIHDLLTCRGNTPTLQDFTLESPPQIKRLYGLIGGSGEWVPNNSGCE